MSEPAFGKPVWPLIQAGIALLLAVSVSAHAQSIVGAWIGGTSTLTFQSNGQYTWSTPDPSCGTAIIHGTYTASAGTMSMPITATTCNGFTTPFSASYGSGTYSVSGNMLEIHLTGGLTSPLDLFFTQSTNVSSTTPLPPPQPDQNAYTVTNGNIPAAAVGVSASGTFGNATLSVTLDIVLALQTALATGLQTAGPIYNVYVVALVPGPAVASPVALWFVKPKAPDGWSHLQWPLRSFLENVAEGAANNQVLVEILSNMDITQFAGTEFYIGYGLSGEEMLAAGRYRGIYKAQ